MSLLIQAESRYIRHDTDSFFQSELPLVRQLYTHGRPKQERKPHLSHGRSNLSSLSKKEKNIYNLSTQIALSFDTIEKHLKGLQLSVRSRKAGDRILIRGIHRSLRTLLNEKKIPVEIRKMLPIVTLGDEILWIPNVAARDGILAQCPESIPCKILLMVPWTHELHD